MSSAFSRRKLLAAAAGTAMFAPLVKAAEQAAAVVAQQQAGAASGHGVSQAKGQVLAQGQAGCGERRVGVRTTFVGASGAKCEARVARRRVRVF